MDADGGVGVEGPQCKEAQCNIDACGIEGLPFRFQLKTPGGMEELKDGKGSIDRCKETYDILGTETSYTRSASPLNRKRDKLRALIPDMVGGKAQITDSQVCQSCQPEVPPVALKPPDNPRALQKRGGVIIQSEEDKLDLHRAICKIKDFNPSECDNHCAEQVARVKGFTCKTVVRVTCNLPITLTVFKLGVQSDKPIAWMGEKVLEYEPGEGVESAATWAANVNYGDYGVEMGEATLSVPVLSPFLDLLGLLSGVCQVPSLTSCEKKVAGTMGVVHVTALFMTIFDLAFPGSGLVMTLTKKMVEEVGKKMCELGVNEFVSKYLVDPAKEAMNFFKSLFCGDGSCEKFMDKMWLLTKLISPFSSLFAEKLWSVVAALGKRLIPYVAQFFTSAYAKGKAAYKWLTTKKTKEMKRLELGKQMCCDGVVMHTLEEIQREILYEMNPALEN